jgi:hypothetical protein
MDRQQLDEQERKASMEKTVKAGFSEDDGDSSSEAAEPVQNHRGWKAMPYVIGEWLHPSCPCLISLAIV